MKKKIIIVVILVIIVIIIALMAPPITSNSPSMPSDNRNANLTTPRPTPLLNITKDSDLSEEIKKLDVPDYQPDYDALDKTLSQF